MATNFSKAFGQAATPPTANQYYDPKFGPFTDHRGNQVPEGMYGPFKEVLPSNVQGPLQVGGIRSSVPAPTGPDMRQPVNPAPTQDSGPAPVDRSLSIADQNAAVQGAQQQYDTGLRAVADQLSRLFGRYDEDAAQAEGSYRDQTDTNRGNFARNQQAALLNAAQGRQGLFSVLASLGALGGSGSQLANLAVQRGANADIAGIDSEFQENRSALDTSIAGFRTDDRRRREEAELAGEANRTGLRNQLLTTHQNAYNQLSDDYSKMGNQSEAARYAELARGLYPERGVTGVIPGGISYQSANYAAPALSKAGTPSSSMAVRTSPSVAGSELPGLFALPGEERRRRT